MFSNVIQTTDPHLYTFTSAVPYSTHSYDPNGSTSSFELRPVYYSNHSHGNSSIGASTYADYSSTPRSATTVSSSSSTVAAYNLSHDYRSPQSYAATSPTETNYNYTSEAASIIDEALADTESRSSTPTPAPLLPLPDPRPLPSQFLSLACQCVLVGEHGDERMLARVSVVDYRGEVVMDCLVAPTKPVVSYRTDFTGLLPEHFRTDLVVAFDNAREYVANLVFKKIIVGYRIWDDLEALNLRHPAIDTRDVACYLPFRYALRCFDRPIELHILIAEFMRRVIRNGCHNPVEDARAVVDLFRSREEAWEDSVLSNEWPCCLPPPEYAPFFA